MSSKFRHALVTGGAGFIGHHLVRALLDRGLEVTVLDDLSMGDRTRVPEAARFVEGDVRRAEDVARALSGVDCVFHLAAIVTVRGSMDRFVEDADVNLGGTLRLLEGMRESSVRKAILASSMAVYSDAPEGGRLRETDPTEPISPYGIAKLAAERYWSIVCPSLGIEPTVLRYFNTYGPGQTPTPYVGVITIFVERLLAGERPVIFGDGGQRRDFVHVDDIVTANLLALEGEAAGEVLNVGTGRGTTVSRIAEGLISELRPGTRPKRAPAPPGELREAVADISRIRELLGYRPSRPEVEFSDVISYMKDRASGR